MKKFIQSRDGASKGAALLIALALVVLLAGLALAYFTRTTTDRQLAHSSYNDTSAELLARTALDIVVGDFKQEIITNQPITRSNIQPSPYPIPTPANIPNLIRYSSRDATASRASNVRSTDASANGRSISKARWNSHYLVPRLNTGTAIDSTPVDTFTAPDWVLVTPQGPPASTPPPPSAVIGRYAFAVYDEGGLLDMNLAGYPNFANAPGCADPAPTPWLVNVGRKGIVALADLTALGLNAPPQSQVDKIVGWRNYAMTQQPASFFPSGDPNFSADCTRQNSYGSYLLYFGDPPFSIESLADKLGASIYPFTSVPGYFYPPAAPGVTPRTDQSLMTRQELLKLRRSSSPELFSQNVLQYMGTFSRERNQPAPDWPHLSEPGEGRVLTERFNLNNLALVIPNPADCQLPHGKKVGWQTGRNRNHLCGTPDAIIDLFGLFWRKSEMIPATECPFAKCPGYWKYIYHTGPNPPGDPDPSPNSIICFRDPSTSLQKDFFQVLHYALSIGRSDGADRCGGKAQKARTFAIGASLIDQYDSGADCNGALINWGPGCDLDSHVVNPSGSNRASATHTTVIQYGQGVGQPTAFAYGMEPNYSGIVGSDGYVNGDDPWQGTCSSNQPGSNPHRPCGAPTPVATTQVISHAFSNSGELGYGIDTTASAVPPLKFWDASTSPPFADAPVLDFFSYNPLSSAYPRAGIVNLYTRNKPVIAAMLKSALKNDTTTSPPSSIVTQQEAADAADAIVQETQKVLSGSPTYGSVQQTDLTRAIAGRLAKAAFDRVAALAASDETKNTAARALAEMGQTRTWNLLIDVIAQTGRYSSDAANITQANKFIVEGEKRYWLHIALGRDLVKVDPILGTIPCAPGDTGCQVDVLGTQLEEVTE